MDCSWPGTQSPAEARFDRGRPGRGPWQAGRRDWSCRPPPSAMHHESFMRWFRAAQAAIARPETFIAAATGHERARTATSQASRRFAEALDRAVQMTGIFNRELRDRNAPETSRLVRDAGE